MEYLIQTDKSYFGVIDVELNDLLNDCVKEIDGLLDITPPIVVFGKKCQQNRNIGFFSNSSIGYNYSNQLSPSKPLTPSLLCLINYVSLTMNTEFNGILVNEYINGEQYIGKHSDDEKHLSNVGVVCISYGATRKFRIRDKLTNKIVMDIPTTSHKLWVMGGDFQKEFTHEVPIEKKIKDRRFSFTFRYHKK